MLRTALLATVLLLPSHAIAAAQHPADAYKACLIGHSVTGMVQDGLSAPDAFHGAVGLCADTAAAVPPDSFCTGEAGCGQEAVREYVIHVFENDIAPLLTPPENAY